MNRLIMKKALVFILLSAGILLGQFGQNKVQYDRFEWKYIQSRHFDIYYSGEDQKIADYTAAHAEEAYESISVILEWKVKKRYAIIVYDSHSAFQQTNTISDYMPEGVGGFTELFKNRVVIPYEGSYRDLRHVIHHELVHAMMNDLYFSGNIQSIVSGAVRLNLPLWLAEGSAEYESSRWDTEADMFMRDFAYHSQFEAYSFAALRGYYAYKGGQSIFKFIREEFGYEKVSEFYRKLKLYLDVNKALMNTFNMGKNDFTERWHQYLKESYWPDISKTEDISELSIQLTDHKKWRNYQNITPALSPSGSMIAFLSDRKGYADIYVMDVQDGKRVRRVVRGQRKASLEELKWLSPGISWTPDSKNIIFAAKSGQYDALVKVNVKSGRESYFPIQELKGVYAAACHPANGDLIAFSGHDGSQSDIFLYNMKTGELKNLTRDKSADKDPQWSPDGKRIVYVSERLKSEDNYNSRHPYQDDIYCLDTETLHKERLTHSDQDERYPFLDSQGRGMIYSSDKNGIFNIYVQPSGQDAYPITNVVGGIFHLNLNDKGNILVFSAFRDMGWDVFRMSDPFEMEALSLQNTRFHRSQILMPEDLTVKTVKDLRLEEKKMEASRPKKGPKFVLSSQEVPRYSQYKSYAFVPEHANMILAGDSSAAALDSTDIMDENGAYKSQKYLTKFSLDLVDSQFGFNTFYGVNGQAVFMFSDVLGDHQVYIGTDLYIDLKNSDYVAAYYYRKYRMNFGLVYVNEADNYYTYLPGEITEENPYGYYVTRFTTRSFHLMADYPINRHHRVEFSQSYFHVKRELLDDMDIAENYDADVHEYMASFAFVKDNAVFSYTGPMDGERYRLSLDISPKLSPDTPEFFTLKADYRKYWKLTNDYHIAFRVHSGISLGRDPQIFLLGGIDNWINYVYNGAAPIFGSSSSEERSFSEELNMYYLSEYVMPIRGTMMFQEWGNKYVAGNVELRFPFIEYAKFGIPPVQFFQVRGVLFADWGFAWDQELQLISDNSLWPIGHEWNDLMGGIGGGIRVYLGFALLRIDLAWEYNGTEFSSPRWLFSLGGDI